MKRFYSVLLTILISHPVLFAQSWTKNVIIKENYKRLNDVCFSTPLNGFAGLEGYPNLGPSLISTNDGGIVWDTLFLNKNVIDIHFTSPDTGYLACNEGAVLKTINGGLSWVPMYLGSTTTIMMTFFWFSNDSGYVMGYDPSNSYVVTIWKTVNGGSSWTTINPGTTNTARGLFFLNDSIGFVGHMGGAIIEKTTNGGTTWTSQSIGQDGVQSIFFLNPSLGYAAGNLGQIWRTTDTGTTWVPVFSPTNDPLLKITFIDDLNGWICGYSGTILRTEDGGISWNPEIISSSQNVSGVHMVSPTYGWAALQGQQNVEHASLLKFGHYIPLEKANVIHGKIFHDLDGDCLKDSNEVAIRNMVVRGDPGPFYSLSDIDGNYELALDTGNFMLSQSLSPYNSAFTIPICPAGTFSHIASYNSYGHDTSGFDFGDQQVSCFNLFIDVVTSRKRMCGLSSSSIWCGNNGRDTAYNVNVIVTYPEFITPLSANYTWVYDTDSNLVFYIGTLAPQQEIIININEQVSCQFNPQIIGRTLCIEASIAPNNNCISPSPSWDGSNLESNANCEPGGFARFYIFNTGADMVDSSTYHVFINAAYAYTARFKLAAGDTLSFALQTHGDTYRIQVFEQPYHPSRTFVSSTVEACSESSPGVITTGFMNQLEQQHEILTSSTACRLLTYSFDPNEKEVSPSGTTSNHFIPQHQKLDYTLDFQNVGNDTAFTVVVIDTLSRELDFSTFHAGASSFPYTLDVSGLDKVVLRFTLTNIQLPDSATNQLGSNGFVSYSIFPYDSLPVGTVIENKADIYFDYAPPVTTNIVSSTIMDTTLVSAIQPDSVISTFPFLALPDSICIGDTIEAVCIGNPPYVWRTIQAPLDTIGREQTLLFSPLTNGDLIVSTPDGADTIAFNLVNCSSGIGSIDIPGISIYPNPVTNNLIVEFDNENIECILLRDLQGREILKLNSNGNHRMVVSVEQLKSGIYFLEFVGENRLCRRICVLK